MTLWDWAVRALAAALLCSTIVRAQEAPTLAAGTRVRAIVPPTANAAHPLRCESRVVQAARDTLLLSPIGTCPLGTYNDAVSVLRVDHGSRWKHVAIGFASGAAIGGIVARLAAGDGCISDPCDDGPLAVGLMTMGGIVVGAASGLLFGAAAPAGKEWGAEQAGRVLRVGKRDVASRDTTLAAGARQQLSPGSLTNGSNAGGAAFCAFAWQVSSSVK